MASWLEMAAEKASQQAYGKPCCYLGEGGSIPFMVPLPLCMCVWCRSVYVYPIIYQGSARPEPQGMLGKMFPEAQFLITGVSVSL